jgi:hypothetical protein
MMNKKRLIVVVAALSFILSFLHLAFGVLVPGIQSFIPVNHDLKRLLDFVVLISVAVFGGIGIPVKVAFFAVALMIQMDD